MKATKTVYGIFTWTKTARYPKEKALALFKSERKAETEAFELNKRGIVSVVVRSWEEER